MHLLSRKITYQCHLQGKTLREFLGDWSRKPKLFSPKDWIADFDEGYWTRRMYSDDHLLLQPRLERRNTSPNITLEYRNGKELIVTVTPSLLVYLSCLLPLAFLVFAGVGRLGAGYFLLGFVVLVLTSLNLFSSVINGKANIEKDLSLKFEAQKIPYTILDNESLSTKE